MAKNYYEMLDEAQRTRFDEFWKAFQYRHGKQGAARRWAEIEPIDADEFRRLLVAAKKEAETRGARGTTPPMAALWLAERRWQDADVSPEKKREDSAKIEYSQKLAELSHARSMVSAGSSVEYWQEQAERIEREVTEMRNAEMMKKINGSDNDE